MDRALLIGINAYPGCPLQGCVNDVQNVSLYLVEKLSFSNGDIWLMSDADAATQDILDGLQWLAHGVNAGDRLLFHYSGHGATVPDDDGDESDGVHDVICPVDFDWQPEHMILDKQFLAAFTALPAGVKFNWISDSCHSGHLDRGFAGPRNRQADRPRCYPTPVHIAGMVRDRLREGGHRRGLVNGQLDVGFVAGCRSDQTSADTVIDGYPAGALTGYLLKSLAKLPPVTALDEVVQATAAALRSDGYDQIPQCDGARAALPLLG